MRRVFPICMVFAMLLMCAGCAGAGGGNAFERRLALTGDTEPYVFTVTRYEQPIRLADHIQPRALLITGSDGFTVRIAGDDLSGVTLVYSKEYAWELRAKDHPPSANVKNIMCMVAENENTYTGEMKEEGTSQLNGRSVTVFTPKWEMPERSITSVFHDTAAYLEQGERVMILELDGLGYEMLRRSGAAYVQSLQPEQALACYPPNSQVGLAAMLTGKLPSENGIAYKGERELAVDDMFNLAEQMGKTCVYIEGKSTTINASLKPLLSLNDAEVFSNAQKALAGEPDVLFAHFHEIDDMSHAHGPYAKETQEKIMEIDGYVRALAEGFEGRVIITADHGQHETQEGGNHGAFLPEDMVVPYIVS